jgi:hypothetical protein
MLGCSLNDPTNTPPSRSIAGRAASTRTLAMQKLWAWKVFGGFKKFVLYDLEKVCGRSRKFVVVEKFVLQL